MKRILGTIKKKGGTSPDRGSSSIPAALPQGDAPEAVVVREVTAFCQSGAPDSQSAGDEYLHLPAIVDAAESSPAAAREAAATIRRFLSKEYHSRGYAQYNAIMLTRILTDNPARPFTQSFDAKFVHTVKELLRDGRDSSVQQILRETLDYIEAEKAGGNDTLGPLIEMWRKEKGKAARLRPQTGGMYPMRGPAVPHQSRPPRGLPPPDELAARIEEAKTTARLLLQTIQSTPQSELLANDLVKEFADRVRAAHKSIQSYMASENPRPDEDTMLTLIETNDQLNIAMSKHQRALLQARKSMGISTPSPQPPPPGPERNSYPMPQHTQGQNVYNAPQPMPQSIPGQKVYGNYPPRQPDHGPYSSSPPRNQANSLGPISPIENFSAPPGPPPSQRNQFQTQFQTQPQTQPVTYDYENAYAAPPGPPPVTSRAQPPSHQRISSQTSTSAYGVAENPFTDDAYSADEPKQEPKTYSLFDRAQHHISAGQEQNRNSGGYGSGAQSPQRPGPAANAAGEYQPTQSYINRQDSSANNVTMHGGSPPPPAAATGMGEHDPVSPVDERDVNGVGRRFGETRV